MSCWQWGEADGVAFLDLAPGLSVSSEDGDVREARGDVVGPPDALQALIHRQKSNGQGNCLELTSSCSFVTITYRHSHRKYPVAATIKVVDGFVVEETFVVHDFNHQTNSGSGTVRHSGIDTSHA